MTEPRVVILVPRRDGFEQRDKLWAWVKAWWTEQFPELEMFEGHHYGGLFNRAAALNTASRLAGDWDIALIIDSDVIVDPQHVREGIAIAVEQGRMVVPFTVRHNLNQRGSQRIMDGERGPWERFIAQNFYDQHSSVIAVPRNVWQTVGGFDETFAGWGMEDTAFAISVITLVGPLVHMDGECWHLWHPTAPEGHRGTPSAIANRARGARYQAAMGDADAIRAIHAEQFAEADATPAPGIPRIIHRVVPEKPNEQAEAWWTEFAAMHPGWDLRTHRDPLDPADWPETAAHWSKCTSGAQLAGLIRLEALWRFGGIYVDQDVQPVRSLEPLLSLQAFAAWEDERVVPDAVIGAGPGHPAIRECLDLAITKLRKGAWESGPGVTTKVFPGRSDVLLFPPGAFYAVHYRDADRERLMQGFDPKAHPWAFVLHWYWGSWLAKSAEKSA